MKHKKLIEIENRLELSPQCKDLLTKINENYSGKKLSSFNYAVELRKLLNIDKKTKINKDYKTFLGGFVLGEGSLNASLNKKGGPLGVFLDLEFSVTQSIYGVSHLINLVEIFNTGRFDYKSGSNATFVFTISNRESIFEKALPFWEKYILPLQTSFESQRFRDFKKFEDLFSRGVHKNKEEFISEMLPLWDSLRKQKGQKNQSFFSIEDAVLYIEANATKKVL